VWYLCTLRGCPEQSRKHMVVVLNEVMYLWLQQAL